MGTSTNRLGPRPSIPLLPDWIDDTKPTPEAPTEGPSEPEQPSDYDEDSPESPSEDANESPAPLPYNRFNLSRQGIKSAVQSGDYSGLGRTLKNFFSQAGGGAATSARRMQRSGKAVGRLGTVLGEIQTQGLATTLARYNLSQYVDRPAIEVLSALMRVVCDTSALLDDAVTRQAYAITITRVINETPELNLDALTEGQVAEMMAVFLEESLVYRLICDIGRSLTVDSSDAKRALDIEEQLYQIVRGLIHSRIVPELAASRQNPGTLEQEMKRIYQIAIQTIIGS